MFNDLMKACNGGQPKQWVLKQREDFNDFNNFDPLYSGSYIQAIISDPSDPTNKILDPNGSSSITPSGTWAEGVVTNHEKKKMTARVKSTATGTNYWDYIYTCGFLIQAGTANNKSGHYANSIQLSDIYPVYMNFTPGVWHVVEVIFEPNVQLLTESRTLIVDGITIGTIGDIAISSTPTISKLYWSGRSTYNLVYLDYMEIYKWE